MPRQRDAPGSPAAALAGLRRRQLIRGLLRIEVRGELVLDVVLGATSPQEPRVLAAEPGATAADRQLAVDADHQVLAGELRRGGVDPGHLDAVLVFEVLAEDLEPPPGVLIGQLVRKIDLHPWNDRLPRFGRRYGADPVAPRFARSRSRRWSSESCCSHASKPAWSLAATRQPRTAALHRP